jgi:hypothetical protein
MRRGSHLFLSHSQRLFHSRGHTPRVSNTSNLSRRFEPRSAPDAKFSLPTIFMQAARLRLCAIQGSTALYPAFCICSRHTPSSASLRVTLTAASLSLSPHLGLVGFDTLLPNRRATRSIILTYSRHTPTIKVGSESRQPECEVSTSWYVFETLKHFMFQGGHRLMHCGSCAATIAI